MTFRSGRLINLTTVINTIYKNKSSNNEIRVIEQVGYGTRFETLDSNRNVTGHGTMGTYLLETEFEEVEE